MNITSIVENMTEEMYLRLKHAAETGKWPEGNEAGQEQQERALQLCMAYQAKHLNSDEMLTIGASGEIVTKTKRELKESFKERPDTIARFDDL
ncbi:YeaC family protein [Thalassotalea ganghwensis]